MDEKINSLPLVQRGKVRDIYTVDDQHLLIVTTDRISAFDVVLPTPIPDKGRVLTALSNFWFERLAPIIPNHLSPRPPAEIVLNPAERKALAGRAVIVRRLTPLPVEAIVRGYLAGSAWKEYHQKNGVVCGIALPRGLRVAERLPEAIFTPSTKASGGAHDENIDFATMEALLGAPLAAQVQSTAIALYQAAADYAYTRGIIIADTKFEFGVDSHGQLILIDEALTPDSSRFWPVEDYRPGINPPSFDKQYVRDYLESLAWNKRPPAPALPPEIVAQTTAKYHEALRRLTELN